MMVLVWSALASALTPTELSALLETMSVGVEEIETLREEHTEESVRACIDARLIPMRALVDIATEARNASLTAEHQGQADLEARKVEVAASRLEAQRVAAQRCVPSEASAETEVDCPECPVDAAETDAGEPEVVVESGMEPGSPFE